MKRLLIMVALAALASCGDIEDDQVLVNRHLQDALNSRYPNAVNVKWSMKSNYHVADFKNPVVGNTFVDCEAWFSQQGEWHMTEADIPYEELPEAVKTAFESSKYAEWFIEDIDKVERETATTLYVIELEARDGKRTETDLYYIEDGTLVKDTLEDSKDDGNDNGSNPDDTGGNGGGSNDDPNGGDNGNTDDSGGNGNTDDNYTPEAPKGGIEEFIETNYPGTKILDYEKENGGTEVDILDGKYVRELYFDASGNWLRTITELTPADLPQAVLDALAASDYASWRIDDVEHVLYPNKEFYVLELELGEREKDLRITPEGEIL